MTTSLLLGCCFTVAGFGVLLGQVVAQDLINAFTAITRSIEQAFSDDSFIYPDYLPPPL